MLLERPALPNLANIEVIQSSLCPLVYSVGSTMHSSDLPCPVVLVLAYPCFEDFGFKGFGRLGGWGDRASSALRFQALLAFWLVQAAVPSPRSLARSSAVTQSDVATRSSNQVFSCSGSMNGTRLALRPASPQPTVKACLPLARFKHALLQLSATNLILPGHLHSCYCKS
jgi:hypothetical protein